jgi:Zn-dependent protease with chaperone function
MHQDSTQQQKVIFTNISPKAWEHPTDRATLATLQNIAGVDVLLQKLLGMTSEKALRLIFLASAIRVSARQFPRLHACLQEACHILDAPYIPELYVAQSPFFNAGAIGVERPFIVLNSSVLDMLSDAETLTVIGHELGHCLSGHALYRTLLQMLLKMSVMAAQIPLGGPAVMALLLALLEWNRKSELSADRASLLVAQDPAVVYTLFMKMAGGAHTAQMDLQEFCAQAMEYERAGSVLDGVHKLLNVLFVSHPFPAVRLRELQAWVDSGEYATILAQRYRQRAASDTETLFDTFRLASEGYKEDFSRSTEAIVDVVKNVFDNLDSFRKSTFGSLDTWFDFAADFQKAVSSQEERDEARQTTRQQHDPSPATPAQATPGDPEPAAPPHDAQRSVQELVALLEKLRELRDKGVITEEDFEAQKRKILQRL